MVFTSDHGEILRDHQLMLKGPMMYDCAVRVPLLIRWPGVIEPGDRCTDLVQWIDLAPTFLDAAGLPPMQRAEGQSLLPLIAGDVVADGIGFRDWALSEHRNSSHPYNPPVSTTMLRHDRWKLVVHHGAPVTTRDRTGELYDLVADPDELTNLWNDPAHADVRVSMQEKLLDVLVATEPQPEPPSRRLVIRCSKENHVSDHQPRTGAPWQAEARHRGSRTGDDPPSYVYRNSRGELVDPLSAAAARSDPQAEQRYDRRAVTRQQ